MPHLFRVSELSPGSKKPREEPPGVSRVNRTVLLGRLPLKSLLALTFTAINHSTVISIDGTSNTKSTRPENIKVPDASTIREFPKPPKCYISFHPSSSSLELVDE